MRKTSERKPRELLPLSIIAVATQGDFDAMQMVLRHYEPYITALALHAERGEDGRVRLHYDEDARLRMEARLIAGILKFKM